jgi:hypothetical protein
MDRAEQHLLALQHQLALHRATLQDLWEQRAIYEQAITALKTSEAAHDTRQHDDCLLQDSSPPKTS